MNCPGHVAPSNSSGQQRSVVARAVVMSLALGQSGLGILAGSDLATLNNRDNLRSE